MDERIIMPFILEVTHKGANKEGATHIPPIQIFKVKDGINFSESDWLRAVQLRSRPGHQK